MSHRPEHTLFLVQRLGKMGIKVDQRPGKSFAEGELVLSGTPFESLGQPLRVERARFYTIGFNRLKFCHPRALFSLPALDVARCETRSQVESALRKLWSASLAEARDAQRWLQELGLEARPDPGSSHLLLELTGEQGPPARVLSRSEIQLPSSGALRQVSPSAPGDRRYRPGRSLQVGSDLELEIGAAMVRAAQAATAQREEAPTTSAPPSQVNEVHRILVLDNDRATLTAAESLMLTRGYQVATFQDPDRALQAFRSRSYELVLTAASMQRADGLEFITLVRNLPGMENLPVVLMDERFTIRQKREAAALGVSAFFEKPLSWPVIGPTVVEMLERPPMRRFRRVPIELSVKTEWDTGIASELTEEISRGGFRLRTQRELFPEAVERYRIRLPDPFPALVVEGQVRSRSPIPGESTLLAGIRIFRFLSGEEADWIRLIEGLLGGDTEKPQG